MSISPVSINGYSMTSSAEDLPPRSWGSLSATLEELVSIKYPTIEEFQSYWDKLIELYEIVESSDYGEIMDKEAIRCWDMYVEANSPDIDAIEDCWDEFEDAGRLGEFFLALIENPGNFCFFDGYGSTKFKPLGLSECACADRGTYDRFVTNLRSKFEDEITQDLTSRFMNKDQPVRLMSLGCGGLLQEAILIGKLIKEGFKSIELTLVDFLIDEDVLEDLQGFFKKAFPEVAITWSYANHLSNIESHAKLDLVYAIDFDELFTAYKPSKLAGREDAYPGFNFKSDWVQKYSTLEGDNDTQKMLQLRTGFEDVLDARNLLTPTGALFLGNMQHAVKLSPFGDIKIFNKDDYYEKLDVLQDPPLKNVKVLINMHEPSMMFNILTILLEKGCESIQLVLENRDGKPGRDKESLYQTSALDFIQKLFPQFSDKIQVKVVDDIRMSMEDAYVTFLDTDFIETNVSDYSKACHAVILNKQKLEEEIQ